MFMFQHQFIKWVLPKALRSCAEKAVHALGDSEGLKVGGLLPFETIVQHLTAFIV